MGICLSFITTICIIGCLFLNYYLSSLLYMESNYNKLVKNKHIFINYEDFKRLYKKIQKEFQIECFEFAYITNNDEAIIKIKKNYYFVTSKGLTLLFKEDEIIKSAIYKRLKKSGDIKWKNLKDI